MSCTGGADDRPDRCACSCQPRALPRGEDPGCRSRPSSSSSWSSAPAVRAAISNRGGKAAFLALDDRAGARRFSSTRRRADLLCPSFSLSEAGTRAREFEQLVIEQRLPRFERYGHAHSIDLGQPVVDHVSAASTYIERSRGSLDLHAWYASRNEANASWPLTARRKSLEYRRPFASGSNIP